MASLLKTKENTNARSAKPQGAGCAWAAGLVVASWLASSSAFVLAQTQPLAPFDRIYLDGAVVLNIVQGDTRTLAVSRTGELNIEVVDNVLYIETLPFTSETFTSAKGAGANATHGVAHRVIIDLTLTDLTELIASGHSEIVSNRLAVDSLTLEGDGAFTFNELSGRQLLVISHGAANFEMSGEIAHQVVEAAGAVSYEASELTTQTSEIRLAGAGRLTLWAEEMLDVRIAGTASVSYKGSPRVHKRLLGASHIRQVKQELGEQHARL